MELSSPVTFRMKTKCVLVGYRSSSEDVSRPSVHSITRRQGEGEHTATIHQPTVNEFMLGSEALLCL